jgi:hypothetical protein
VNYTQSRGALANSSNQHFPQPSVAFITARYFPALSLINTVDDKLDKWNVSLSRSAKRTSASDRAAVDYVGDDAPVETTVL